MQVPFKKKTARLSENGTMVTFASDTSFLQPCDKDGSESVAALWSGFCARSWKLQGSPFEHWPFAIHW